MGEHAYVARYGWTRGGAVLVAAIALLIGAGFVPGAQPAGNDHIELVLAPVALWTATVATSRRTMLVADAKGLRLRGPWPFSRALVLPWADVAAVDWSQEGHRFGRAGRLTVHRRTQQPVPPAPSTSPALAPLDHYLATQVPPDVVADFRSTVELRFSTALVRLDPPRLAASLTHLAPSVRHFGDLGDLPQSAPVPTCPPP